MRTVNCVDKVVGELLFDERCASRKPNTEETCYKSVSCAAHLPQIMGRDDGQYEGASYAWVVGDWSMVSKWLITTTDYHHAVLS